MLNYIIDRRGSGSNDGDADRNLDRLNALLDVLQGADGSGQRFVDNAETLILVATSHDELDEHGYGTRTPDAGYCLRSVGRPLGLCGGSARGEGMTTMPLFHHLDLRVMWPDADAAGIAWFGHYFRYFENAEEDLFRRLGHDRTVLLRDLHIFMPRTSLQSSFRSPARLGDEISVGVGVTTITDRRVGYAFDIRERGTGRLICDAGYRVACVDATTFAARSFPPEIATLLAPATDPKQFTEQE